MNPEPKIPRGWERVKNGRIIRDGDKWWPSEIPATVTVGERLAGYGKLIRRKKK